MTRHIRSHICCRCQSINFFRPSMFRRRENHRFPLWVAIAIVLQCVIAERADADTSLITLNTRTFDMQADVSEMRRNDSFIPLRDIDWLRELLHRDEYLHGTVVQFKAKSRPVLDGWPPNEYYERFTRLDGIPEELMVDGLLARSAHESNMDILYTPLGSGFITSRLRPRRGRWLRGTPWDSDHSVSRHAASP